MTSSSLKINLKIFFHILLQNGNKQSDDSCGLKSMVMGSSLQDLSGWKWVLWLGFRVP